MYKFDCITNGPETEQKTKLKISATDKTIIINKQTITRSNNKSNRVYKK